MVSVDSQVGRSPRIPPFYDSSSYLVLFSLLFWDFLSFFCVGEGEVSDSRYDIGGAGSPHFSLSFLLLFFSSLTRWGVSVSGGEGNIVNYITY